MAGYGKNASGYMAMRFGPLGADGGERRLNVLISRAKRRCQVFTSITSDDIVLERARGRGVASFKVFLAYAKSGKLSIATFSGRGEESPFEESVRRAVQSLGYEADPQVGQAGFFIDLGVRDAEQPGRYLLGIECDGATYHSSRSARDRDRLRQAVLEDHGWIIHRVWSTDWFQRRNDQLKKIAAAIETAKLNPAYKDRNEAMSQPVASVMIEREVVTPELDGDTLKKYSTPYKEAQFQVPKRQEPHTLPVETIADIVLKIVQIEGPIHEAEVLNRVRDLWGYSRAGARIQGVVAEGINSVLSNQRCRREDGFLLIPAVVTHVRNRENVDSPELRKPEMIPPAELQAAVLIVIDAGRGAGGAEIPVAVARMLGFGNTSAQLRQTIESQISRLAQQNKIVEVDGMYRRK